MMSTDQSQLRKAGRKWPWIIVGLLSVHVAGMVTAAMIATHDRSFAVVDNYYEKAVHWDQSQAILRASREMGWKVEIHASERVDPLGRRRVDLIVTDGQGGAIGHAVLNVEYFHDAHANEVRKVTLSPSGTDPSHFGAVLPMRYAGMWEYQVTVTAGDKTYIEKKTTDAEECPDLDAGRRDAMTALTIAIFTASILGSFHCAGMCGAFLAVATGDLGGGGAGRPVLQTAYHVGRLVSYLCLGAAAGAAGGVVNIAGGLAGIRPLAAGWRGRR